MAPPLSEIEARIRNAAGRAKAANCEQQRQMHLRKKDALEKLEQATKPRTLRPR